MKTSWSVLGVLGSMLPSAAFAQAVGQGSPPGDDWTAVFYVLLVLLVIAIAIFAWFMMTRAGRDPATREKNVDGPNK